mgnify:CR=1 FL=1
MSDFTPKLPEVKFNKNGYEIRTDILDMAKGLVSEEFHVKFQGWEMSAERDPKTGQLISTLATGTAASLTLSLSSAATTVATIPSGTVTLQDLGTAQSITGIKTFSTAPVISSITNTGTITITIATGGTAVIEMSKTASYTTPLTGI